MAILNQVAKVCGIVSTVCGLICLIADPSMAAAAMIVPGVLFARVGWTTREVKTAR